ncbi:hypothetical protein HAX54_002189, partial [Datura stramonium]|nr:hypothetical protein [Datura stramonium]
KPCREGTIVQTPPPLCEVCGESHAWSAFEEPLDDDDATILTDSVVDLDMDEDDDATTSSMQVDGKDDDEY